MIAKQFSDAFNTYAAEGRSAYNGDTPLLSHVCFKFASQEAYADYVSAAQALGRVTSEEFNGKEITWVQLAAPLEKDGLRLEYLELVEPRTEKHAFNGVANIGYAVPGLAAAVKLSSSDKEMSFRYQSQHAKQMAPKA